MTEERIPIGIRAAVLGLLSVFLVAGAFTRAPHNAVASVVGIALAVAAGVATLDRRVTIELAGLILCTAGVVLDAGGQHSSIGWFGVCAVAFLSVLTLDDRLGAAFGAGCLVLVGYKLFNHGFNASWLPWVGGTVVSALGAKLIVHDRSLLLRLRAAQADLAERSRAEERQRIARDLHDVIAHSLTVSLLHVSAARLAVEHDPADAARSLAEAERLGRESLDEVRSIVGLMRDRSDGGLLIPTPGLDGIEELVDRFRGAGVPITLAVEPDLPPVPATVGTTAYRITQEALTNAVKHAPGAGVAVRLCAARGAVNLTIDSEGPPGHGTGSGLMTMRERAEAVGGLLSAEPAELDAGPGWRVSAEFPTRGGWFRP